MSDTEMSDAELAALLKQYEEEVKAENVKPEPLTPEELQKQMDALEAEYNKNNPTTPTTPLMSDEEYKRLLDELAEYSGGKTRRHKMRSYKKKHTHKKKRTYRKSMNKKKRANRTTHRRRH